MTRDRFYEIRRTFDDTVIAILGPAPLSLVSGVDWDAICEEVEAAGENMADIKFRTIDRQTGDASPWERGRDGQYMCEYCDGKGVTPAGDCPACEGDGIANDDYHPPRTEQAARVPDTVAAE